MKGYYNMPEQTAAAITSDGWLRSGDQASMDADGNVRITGRIKDLIIRGGENVAPKEVEDVLRQHSAIADVSVYGIAASFSARKWRRRFAPIPARRSTPPR